MDIIKVNKTKEEKNKALSNQDLNSDWYKVLVNGASEGFSLSNLS